MTTTNYQEAALAALATMRSDTTNPRPTARLVSNKGTAPQRFYKVDPTDPASVAGAIERIKLDFDPSGKDWDERMSWSVYSADGLHGMPITGLHLTADELVAYSRLAVEHGPVAVALLFENFDQGVGPDDLTTALAEPIGLYPNDRGFLEDVYEERLPHEDDEDEDSGEPLDFAGVARAEARLMEEVGRDHLRITVSDGVIMFPFVR